VIHDTINLQLAQRGVIVLPKPLREAYNLHPGDQFTLLDLDGVFVLSPRRSESTPSRPVSARELAKKRRNS